MCTASWHRGLSGYRLFFNRDELRTRGEARAPQLFERDGVRALAPVDGDGGGSWIGVNQHGLSLGLLNGYQDELPRDAGRLESRGGVVTRLLFEATHADLEEGLAELPFERLRGFRLLVLDAAGEARLHRWDGRELSLGLLPELPLTSSSRDPEGAGRARRQHLEALRQRHGELSERVLVDFHTSHEPERGARSTCMHRDDASTVSASWIAVEEERVLFRYAPGAPCEVAWMEPRRLARHSSGHGAPGGA